MAVINFRKKLMIRVLETTKTEEDIRYKWECIID